MFNQNSVILLINLTSSNVLFALTSLEGKILVSTSTGQFKSKGAKKVTLTTLKSCLLTLTEKLHYSFKIHIKFKGLNKHKRLLLKLLTKNFNSSILSFCDITSVPHNGVKSRKIRRF